MPTSKTYSITGDFPNQKVDLTALSQEIRASSISVALDYVSSAANDVDVFFKAEIDAGNETLLDVLIAAHTGDPIPDSPTKVILDGTPTEYDGRINIVNAPMTNGMMAWWTGAGDDKSPAGATSGRGEGDDISINFSGPGDFTQCIEFSSFVEIFDGEVTWGPVTGWSNKDRWWLYVFIPKNDQHCTSTPGTGNCNIVPVPDAGFSMLVPAAGDGSHTIDLSKACPLPAKGTGMEFWQVGSYAHENDPTPSLDGAMPTGDHALLYDIGWRVYFCSNMPMGSPRGVFVVDSDKAEPINKNWKIAFRVKKVSERPGEAGGWFKFFRPSADEPDIPPTE